MKQQLSLKISSSNELIGFLKRFSSIESSLLIELEGNELKAKTHTADRSVVKSSKIDLGRVFADAPTVPQPILFGVYNVDKLIKSFSHFSDGGIDFVLDYEATPEGNVGTELNLSNESLKINLPCASLRLFTHITDAMMDRIAATDEALVDFVLTKEAQNRINSLANIDSDHKLLTFEIKDNKVKALGKSFNLNLLNLDKAAATTNITLYKNQFAFLDREDSVAYVSEDRIVYTSLETETKTIIGKAE